MSTKRIRRSLEAPWACDLDLFELRGIQPGQEVDVPAEMAGRAPHWRPLQDGEQQVAWKEYRQDGGHTEVRDLGSGLLAQLGLWEEAGAPPSPTAGPSTDDAKGAA